MGLPEGQMGNSEVGHLNIGAGRVIYMDVTRIDLMISSGEFFSHPLLLEAMKHARNSHLHLLGCCRTAASIRRTRTCTRCLKMAKEQGVREVFVHCFMDGRDTPPESGAGFIEAARSERWREYGIGKIATCRRPLLRDGSRQALGAGRAGIWRHGARQRREGHGSGGGGQDSPTNAASRTNLSSRSRSSTNVTNLSD